MIDRRLTIAAPVPAPPELGVELLQQLSGDLREWDVAERRLNAAPDVSVVAVESRLLGLVHPQPRIEGRAERCPGPRVVLRLDLGPHPVQDPCRLGPVGRRLDHPQFPAGERVDARVQEHLVGVPALADVPALPSRADALGHPGSVPGDTAGDSEGYAKPSLKKCRPIAARNEDKKVFSGRL